MELTKKRNIKPTSLEVAVAGDAGGGKTSQVAGRERWTVEKMAHRSKGGSSLTFKGNVGKGEPRRGDPQEKKKTFSMDIGQTRTREGFFVPIRGEENDEEKIPEGRSAAEKGNGKEYGGGSSSLLGT